MKKNVWIFGLIAGAINAMWLVGFALSGTEIDFDNGELMGYTAMIISFAFIFVGIKNYRDKYQNGAVTFAQAFKVGLYISLIASTIYVLTWLIEFYYFIPDFGEKYAAHMIDKMKSSGAPQAEIDEQVIKMKSFSEMYKNPFINAGLTYMEILPLGLLISLISSFLLKKKPAQAL